MSNLIHYPRLDTVLMVEGFIQKHSGKYKKKALWEHLPKKMMYQTYCVVISYLIKCHKIIIDNDGKVVWVFNPSLIEKLLKRSVGA